MSIELITFIVLAGIFITATCWWVINQFYFIDFMADKGGFISEDKAAAENHPEPILPALLYYEADSRFTSLYNHARRGQIKQNKLRRMYRKDLYYLAGMDYVHPYFLEVNIEDKTKLEKPGGLNKEEMEELYKKIENERERRWDEATKLQGNVSRAKRELARRNYLWTAAITTVGVVAAIIRLGSH